MEDKSNLDQGDALARNLFEEIASGTTAREALKKIRQTIGEQQQSTVEH